MKTKIISKRLLSLGLVFVLVSAITQVRGGTVTIHSTGDVVRGKTGSFVLRVPCLPGQQCTTTCRPGVGVIPLQTLPDPRASFFPQAYSVVVTLKAGPGYTI